MSKSSTFVPKEIKVISGSKRGAVYSSLDKSDIQRSKIQWALSPDLDKNADVLMRKATAIANTTSFKNDVYHPTIKQGVTGYSNKKFTYTFTAPDSKTQIPLITEHLTHLLTTCTIKNGQVLSDVVLAKELGNYFPVNINSELGKIALGQSYDADHYTSTKDLNEGDIVIFEQVRYLYCGIYSTLDTYYWGPAKLHRRHVLKHLDNNRFISALNYTKKLVRHSKAASDYKPEDYSVALINHSKQFWAKTTRELGATIDTLKWVKDKTINILDQGMQYTAFKTLLSNGNILNFRITQQHNYSGYGMYGTRSSSGTKAKPSTVFVNYYISGHFGGVIQDDRRAIFSDFQQLYPHITSTKIDLYKSMVKVNGKDVELEFSSKSSLRKSIGKK